LQPVPFSCTTGAKKPRNEKAIIIEPKLGPGEYHVDTVFFDPGRFRYQQPRHKSRFTKDAVGVIDDGRRRQGGDHTVYGGIHLLPLDAGDIQEAARKQAMKGAADKRRSAEDASPEKAEKADRKARKDRAKQRGRRAGMLLEGANSDFADGRDNLLIHALLREETERVAKQRAIEAAKKGEKLHKSAAELAEEERQKKIREGDDWEKWFQEEVKVKPDEIEMMVHTTNTELMELRSPNVSPKASAKSSPKH